MTTSQWVHLYRWAQNHQSMKAFSDPAVAEVFAVYSTPMRSKLMSLRELIYTTASLTPGAGELEETLKWGQPSYLTTQTKSGSTIRIDAIAAKPGYYAIYFHCQTDLVDTFRKRYGTVFRYEGNRAIIFSDKNPIRKKELSDCIALALTYHLKRKRGRVSIGSLIR